MFFLKRWKNYVFKVLFDEKVGIKAILYYLMKMLVALLALPVFVIGMLLFPIYYIFTRIQILLSMPFAKRWVMKNVANLSDSEMLEFYNKCQEIKNKNVGWILNTHNKKLYKYLKEVMAKRNLPSYEDEL